MRDGSRDRCSTDIMIIPIISHNRSFCGKWCPSDLLSIHQLMHVHQENFHPTTILYLSPAGANFPVSIQIIIIRCDLILCSSFLSSSGHMWYDPSLFPKVCYDKTHYHGWYPNGTLRDTLVTKIMEETICGHMIMWKSGMKVLLTPGYRWRSGGSGAWNVLSVTWTIESCWRWLLSDSCCWWWHDYDVSGPQSDQSPLKQFLMMTRVFIMWWRFFTYYCHFKIQAVTRWQQFGIPCDGLSSGDNRCKMICWSSDDG